MNKIITILLVSLWLTNVASAQDEVIEGKILAHWDTTQTVIPPSVSDLRYNDIWGIIRDGKEYAVLGSSQGTHFIDITDTSKPLEQLFFIPGAVQHFAIHRDYHDYQCYVYAVCDEGPSTLQIMDISLLPDTVTVVYDSSALFNTAHNIFIDSLNARMYAFSVNGMPDIERAGVAIYSLEDPINPVLLASYSDFGGIETSSVHDGYIRDNIAYLNLGPRGFAIMDYSDPENPIPLGTLTDYPDKGYNHSGWLSDDGSHYYLGDETNGKKVKSLNVSDPADITVDTLFDANSDDPNSITHNQVVACNYLYISYYGDGLQVYDISEPAYPKRVLFSNSYVQSEGIWGVFPFFPSNKIIVSDIETGLYVIEGINDGCKAKQPTACDVVLASNDLNFDVSNFEIHPNPTDSDLSINLSLLKTKEKNAIISIVDLNGKIVFKQQKALHFENNWHINTNDLAQGFYILKIKNAQLSLSQKIVVVH